MNLISILLIYCFFAGLFDEHPEHSHYSVISSTCHSAVIDSNYQQLFPTIPEHLYDSIFTSNTTFTVDGFDFPVGKPDAQGYYLAQRFGQNRHLGEDWNGKNGGNTDLGDPVYGIAHGLVTFADHVCCGWGNTIRVVHFSPEHAKHQYVESIYAHLDDISVKAGDLIRRGQQIGTIGTADGKYTAHLHLEMRSFISMSLGPGYSDDQYGYLDPSDFIKMHRPN